MEQESIIYSHMFLPDNLIAVPRPPFPEGWKKKTSFGIKEVVKMGFLSTAQLSPKPKEHDWTEYPWIS